MTHVDKLGREVRITRLPPGEACGKRVSQRASSQT
jgi:hypothetical protein